MLNRALCATCEGAVPLAQCPQCHADATDHARAHPFNGDDRCDEWRMPINTATKTTESEAA